MDEETATKQTAFLRRHWPLMVVLMLLLAPGIWGVLVFVYSARIDALKERLSLCEDRRQFAEGKLRSEPAALAAAVPPSSALPGSGTIPNGSGNGRYPPLDNPAHPTQEDVRRLAEYYDLTKPWPSNPHLRFKTGDISYWREQGLSSTDLDREFESRRLVLLRADKTRTSIPSQGDLSHAAELLQGRMGSVGRPTRR
jgi:hypothetical protein